MRRFSTLAVMASLLAGGAMLSAPADAQKKKKGEEAAAEAEGGQRKLKLSKAELAAVQPLDAAVTAKDWAAAAAALPAAQAAAASADAKYYVASRQFSMAIGTGDKAAQATAISTMIDSGMVAPTDLPKLYSALGSLYYNAKDYDRAAVAFEKLSQLDPNNADNVLNVAKIRGQQKRYPEAISALEGEIARASGAGGKASEETYKLALQYALDAKLKQQQVKLSRDLIGAYPTPENWRLVLDVYRSAAALDSQASIDLFRMMRAAKLLQKNDYYDFAYELNERGLPGETKAVLDEGARSGLDVSRKNVKELMTLADSRVTADRASLAGLEKQAGTSANGKLALGTADAYLGYGEYAKAAALYRTALQKGSVDADLANTRLGTALALSGNKAEAEAAFKAVKGPRTELANFWLLWLSKQA